MKKENLNGSSISFEQDNLISFEEASHTYYVEGVGEMTPVSTVISKFFIPFDADYWSDRKCYGDAVAAAKMREEWAFRGAVASQAGTYLHKQIENYLNEKVEPASMTCDINFAGTFINEQTFVNISREWAYFKAFDKTTEYTPFRTEWCVYDVEARMAGTIDLLCSRDDGSYEIYDWKRSNKINPSEENQRSMGLHGLEHLPDTSYVHYCLQQNLYRYMLEKNYGIRISNMSLVVLHPELPSFEVVSIPRLESEVNIIINYLLQNK